jgi:fibronectin type 3 domain-containing protein
MKRTAGKSRHSHLHSRHSHIEPLENRQLLSASISVSNSLLVFNAVKGTASTTESLTITDTGSSALTLGSGAFSLAADSSSPTNDVARFSILNASAAPSSLSSGQSFTLNLSYNANAIVTNKALLEIATNDPVNPQAAVSLHGIGTKGLGGSNQPSLATILQAYNIPTYVGEGFDDDNAATDSTYPYPPDASSQEVVMQSFVKAGSGPVTINVLASFTASGFSKSYELGTYPQGSPNSLSELFYTNSTQNQTTYVQPIGSTTFDPGSGAFGFYAISNEQTKGRVIYSEDAYNTWDTTTGRHFRFFPMETSNGTIVPNTYIMTSTEWNAPVGYDFTNIVAVVSNIKAAPNAPASPAISLQPSNPLPGSNRMIFNDIINQNTTVGDTFHNTGTLNVTDTGQAPLTVSSYSLSSGWALVNPPTFPLTIQPGQTDTLTIKFTQSTEPAHSYNETNDVYEPNDGAALVGSLTLFTNDPNHSSVSQTLAGWYQNHSEDSEEPSLQTIVNVLAGWSTNIDSSHINDLTETTATTGSPTYYGQEVVSAYWQEADTSAPVTVQQLAAFHTQGNTATTSYYLQGKSGSPTKLFNTATDYGQTFFPAAANGSAAVASFSTTSSFGFLCDGNYTDDSLNKNTEGGGHHMRFYPVVDANGAVVPNTYLMCMDYAVTPENFDFQDNVWIVSNIKPVTTSSGISSPQTTAAPATPIDFHAAGTASGVLLEWAGVSGAAGYNIYRSTSETGTYSQVNSSLITSTSYIDTSVNSGTTYYYEVTSYDSTLKVNSLAALSSTTALSTGKVTPSQPTGFTATGIVGAINLAWSSSNGDATLGGYYLYVGSSASGSFTLLATLSSTATSYTDTTASTSATTYYQLRAYDANSGYVSSAASASAVAQSASTGLTSVDIGATPSGSTTVITPNVAYNVTAGGPGIAANADGFRFIYQQQTGNFDMMVQVTSLTVAGNYATAGILARTSLTTTSPDVYMSASPVNYRFKWRTTDGGVNNVSSGANVSFPNAYVRLTRVGNVFNGYYSTDGKNWTLLSSETISLPSTLYLGLAVASNNTTQTTTATLRGYGATVTAPTPPAAVTGLTATGQTGSVLLNWNASSDSTLKGYNVYSSSSASGTYTLLTTSPITNTTYTDSAAAIGVPTYYKVTVVDASSGLESAAATASATATSSITAPAPVTGLTATGQVGSVQLNWNPSSDATLKGYNVYSSSSPGGTFALLTGSPITNTSYTDSSATIGSPTYYKVTVVDASSGLESTPATANATATSSTPTPPSPVTGLTATGQVGSVKLSWNASGDATLQGYNVYSSSSATGFFTLLTSSPITATSYTDSAATIGSPTYYKVTVVDASSGLESSAATASATAQAATTGLTSLDIGATPSGSTTVVTPNVDYNVTAGGPGVAAYADGFRFIYQQQTGNFDVTVQVTSLTVAGNYSTAGILARTALTTTSPDVYMAASPVNYRFKWRTTDGGLNNISTGASVTFPNAYVRLSRVGNVFTGYYSTNGTTWTTLGTETVALPSTLYLGLAVASNNTTQTTSATLRGYGPTSVGSTPTPPAAVTGLTATGQTGSVALSWNASSDSTLKGYNVYSSSSANGTYTLLTSSPINSTTYIDSSATIGSPTYYKVTVVDAVSGLESSAATASATATAAVTTLTSADIGASAAGSTTINGGSYTVTAGGPGIAANVDGFRYLYTSVTGNFDVSVQVTSLTVAGNYSTAGILARSSLTTTSPDVYMSASPVNYRFKWRTTDGGVNNVSSGANVSFPNAYVRLTRVGNVFTGYYSTNGTTWTELSSETVALPTTIYLGLAVASNNTTQTTTATMQNYTGPT